MKINSQEKSSVQTLSRIWTDMFGRNRADNAYDIAMQALTITRAHVDECNRREEDRTKREVEFSHKYASDTLTLTTAIQQVHNRVSGLGKSINLMFWAGASSFIAVLLTVIGWLLIHGLPYSLRS